MRVAGAHSGDQRGIAVEIDRRVPVKAAQCRQRQAADLTEPLAEHFVLGLAVKQRVQVFQAPDNLGMTQAQV
ncbi:hypothetical protein D3C78_1831390 [compost metagenome]